MHRWGGSTGTRLALAGLLLVLLTAGARAETDTWIIRNDYYYAIELEFYSQDYDRAWPGGSEVYVLRDGKFHQFTLECYAGEKICYGAWVEGDIYTYWGAGYAGQEGCDNCCSICDGGTREITLY